MDGKGGDIVMDIRTPSDFFINSLNFTGAVDNMAYPLLHVNCEGCEYEVFEALIKEKMLDKFSVINISFHYMSGINRLFTRYCRVREHLLQFYSMDKESIAFGWERWVHKTNDTSSSIIRESVRR